MLFHLLHVITLLVSLYSSQVAVGDMITHYTCFFNNELHQ